jgi:Protein of unknown function (DUF2934)
MAREFASTGNSYRASVAEAAVASEQAEPAGAPLKGHLVRPLSLVPHRLTPAERYRRICELAYRKAEQRGFAPGGEVEDWLDAEREVDAGRY